MPVHLTPAIQKFYICYSATISTTLPQSKIIKEAASSRREQTIPASFEGRAFSLLDKRK